MVVPGCGRLSDSADVGYYRDMLTIIRDNVREMIRRAMTVDEAGMETDAGMQTRLFRFDATGGQEDGELGTVSREPSGNRCSALRRQASRSTAFECVC
jgi:hypothetical protein